VHRSFLKKCQIVFFISGVLALGYSGFVLLEGMLYQRHALQQIEKNEKARGTNSVPAAPDTSPNAQSPGRTPLQPVADGTSFARLTIERLNLNVAVVEGDTDRGLRLGAGHIPNTSLPGNPGNVGIAAHRDTFFRPLRNIREGDIITLSTSLETYQYKVDSTQIVTPEHSEVLLPTPEPSLTLVTCFPFYYVGSAPKRFIVRAHELSTAHSGNALNQLSNLKR
jgi:sortase A